MDITTQIAYFTSLSYETRRDKVLEMLNQLKGTHETFAMVYTALSGVQEISANILVYIYQSILEIAEEINAGRKENAQDKIKKMAEVLIIIKNQEEKERAREGNPDDILQNMENNFII